MYEGRSYGSWVQLKGELSLTLLVNSCPLNFCCQWMTRSRLFVYTTIQSLADQGLQLTYANHVIIWYTVACWKAVHKLMSINKNNDWKISQINYSFLLLSFMNKWWKIAIRLDLRTTHWFLLLIHVTKLFEMYAFHNENLVLDIYTITEIWWVFASHPKQCIHYRKQIVRFLTEKSRMLQTTSNPMIKSSIVW